MSRAQEVQDLRLRAERLENEAIAWAEQDLGRGHRDWPRALVSRSLHAELKFKAAAVLRARAEGQ